MRIDGASLLAALLACAACDANGERLDRPGDRIELRLVAESRDGLGRFPYVPEDTVRVVLVADSVRGDSLFGTYHADFRRFAVVVGTAPTGAQPFEGEMRDGGLRLQLSPDSYVTHVGMLLDATWEDGRLVGRWETEALPHAQGSFTSVRSDSGRD